MDSRTKECKNCGKVKPLNEFHLQGLTKSGNQQYRSQCKSCWNLSVRTKEALDNGTKRCKECKDVKPLSEFHLQGTHPNGKPKHRAMCKTCYSTITSDRYSSDVEYRQKQLDRYKRYRQEDKYKEFSRLGTNRYKARKNELPDTLTNDQWGQIMADFDGKCALTGSSDVHLEHFIPISSGHGGTCVGNVYPMDGSLNISKNDNNPFEWIKQPNIREKIDLKKWNSLVAYLATQNEIDVDTFISFVYTCFEKTNSKVS